MAFLQSLLIGLIQSALTALTKMGIAFLKLEMKVNSAKSDIKKQRDDVDKAVAEMDEKRKAGVSIKERDIAKLREAARRLNGNLF